MIISLLGSGNVASALGNAFALAGTTIQQVYDRKLASSQKLARQLKADATDNISKLAVADVFLICVSDDAIERTANEINSRDQLCVHTSGSTPMTIFPKRIRHHGVFYPLQTISSGRKINFKQVPICIEGNSKPVEKIIKDLAHKISDKVHLFSTEQRMYLHLAAVIANNFTNVLYAKAADLLEDHHLSFQLLHSLIAETSGKATELDPRKVQTGPASRNDRQTIKKHLQLLEFYPDLRKIYLQLSRQIEQQQKN